MSLSLSLSLSLDMYIYIYICIYIYRERERDLYISRFSDVILVSVKRTHSFCASRPATQQQKLLHPVCCLRFVSDWTQPLDILSADSECICYYRSNKWCLGNPTLGTNLGQRILAMRTGCIQPLICCGRSNCWTCCFSPDNVEFHPSSGEVFVYNNNYVLFSEIIVGLLQ